MRKLLVLGVVAVLLFGLSAAASLLLQHWKTESEKAEEQKGKILFRPAPERAPDAEAGKPDQRSAERVQLARLEERRKLFEVIVEDIKTQQRVVDDKRRQADELKKDLQGKLDKLQEKFNELEKERKKNVEQMDLLQKKSVTFKLDEVRNIKDLASAFERMDVESAAQIFQDMAVKDMDRTAKILHEIGERQRAKLLAEIKKLAKPFRPDVTQELINKMLALQPPPPASPPAELLSK